MCSDAKYTRTSIVRKTLATTMREILGACPENAHVIREVRLLVPASPQVYVALDLEEVDAHSVRTYEFPPVYPGAPIKFKLGPTQKLFAQCTEGFAITTLIIEEYLVGGDA